GIAIGGLIVLFIVELAGVILAFVYSDFLAGNLSEVLSEQLNDSYSQFPNQTQEFLGVLQTQFSCCGVNNGSDYATYTGFVMNFVCLPDGCSNGTTQCATISNYTVMNGC
ncbi:tetraspanin family protein, partial [Salmonella sp. s51228]|uniref:tetraspanin family protein n=1 Tax=Salmonella sp. s51228 TaxID=3159652 RepID=UPI00397EA5D8